MLRGNAYRYATVRKHGASFCGGARWRPARRDIIEKLLILTDINGLLFGGRVLILKKTQEVITMKDVVDKCSTKGCAIDVGTIIDNEDCVYRAEKVFPSREEAESTVAAVRERAAAAAPASEPPPGRLHHRRRWRRGETRPLHRLLLPGGKDYFRVILAKSALIRACSGSAMLWRAGAFR